jgi:hypothetical protein
MAWCLATASSTRGTAKVAGCGRHTGASWHQKAAKDSCAEAKGKPTSPKLISAAKTLKSLWLGSHWESARPLFTLPWLPWLQQRVCSQLGNAGL